MNRRKFIASVGFLILSLSFLIGLISDCESHKDNSQLLQDFLPEDMIQLIGREYLKTHPAYDQNRVAALSKTQLLELIHQDFEQEHTTIVAGWVLSETEAQYCAFIYSKNH